MSSCSSIFKMLSFCPILIKPQNLCLHLEAPCLGHHTALVRELVTRILPTTFCKELSLLRSLKYLKIYMLPLLTQPFVLLPRISPTTMLLCLLAIFYYSTTWGYKPHRTQGQERRLFRTASEIPWHMKRKVSSSGALQQLLPNWNRNSKARIIYVKLGDKVSSAKDVSITAQSSRKKQTNLECKYLFLPVFLGAMKINVDTLF